MSRIDELVAELCPEGVEYRALGEVATYTRGLTYKKSDETSETDGLLVLRSNNIDLARNVLDLNGVKAVSPTVKVRGDQRLVAGDILISAASGSREHVGKVAHVDTDTSYYFGGFMAVIRARSPLLSRFLFHLLTGRAFEDFLGREIASTTINNLSARLVGQFPVPVPPLPIQQEIVRILDGFTQLEAKLEAELEAELEARRRQYEHYRDELLSCSRDGHVNWRLLGDVAQLTYGVTAKGTEVGEYRFLRITDITEQGQIARTGPKYVPSFAGAADYLARAGDLFVARTGATYGKTALIRADEESVFASFLIRVRVDRAVLCPVFYWHFSQSDLYWRQARRLVSLAGQPQFNGNAVRRVRVPVPPLEEQRRIADTLDTLDALVNDLSSGLPAEIAARRQQYEYYRDRLLTFSERGSEVAA